MLRSLHDIFGLCLWVGTKSAKFPPDLQQKKIKKISTMSCAGTRMWGMWGGTLGSNFSVPFAKYWALGVFGSL